MGFYRRAPYHFQVYGRLERYEGLFMCPKSNLLKIVFYFNGNHKQKSPDGATKKIRKTWKKNPL